MEVTLGKSASAPGLGASLRAAGASSAGLGGTTNLYDKMRSEGKLREQYPNIRPAGRSIVCPLGDNFAAYEPPATPIPLRKYRRQSQGPGEIHCHFGLKDQPLPAEDHRYGQPKVPGLGVDATMKAGYLAGVAEYKNSVGERVYESTKRKSLAKTYIRGHDVKVPEKGFGKREFDPVNDEDTAPGQPARCPFPKELQPPSDQDRVVFSFNLGGVDSAKLVANPKLNKNLQEKMKAAVCESCAPLRIQPKDVFLQPSHTEEGLVVKVQVDPPDDVSVESVKGKFDETSGFEEAVGRGASQVYGMDKISLGPLRCLSASSPEIVRGTASLYRFSHNTMKPSEQSTRSYAYPKAVVQPNFRFGADPANAVEGAGAKLALNMQVETSGDVIKTRIHPKVSEDYRNVKHPKMFKTMHYMQGSGGPPVPQGHSFGCPTKAGLVTAEQVMKGAYSLQEQLPDQDLGRCVKPGRRNVTTETRAFGTPSIRTDIPAPSERSRSIADPISYGDEPGAAALLGPQRFDERGVPDAEFLIRRPKEELASLVQGLPHINLQELWPECLRLFDDDLQLVSLDAVLYVHSQRLDLQVSQNIRSFETTLGVPGRGMARSASATA